MEAEARSHPSTTTFNVLFVCTGNTCRSPMAEAAMRAELERRGWRHVQVGSAGVAAASGEPAAHNAISVAGRNGLHLASHRSRSLTPELVAWADLILAMSDSHLGPIARLGGADKMAMLGEFAAGDTGAGCPVPDPFGGDEATYERTLRELQALVSRALDRLSPILHP